VKRWSGTGSNASANRQHRRPRHAESALWLDAQQPGLGDDFLAAVQAAFADISRSPTGCPTLDLPGIPLKSALRWHSIGRFPHLAIFTVQGNDILVVAVLHGHRDLESILRSRVGIKP
jgi:plasmid stabilization system protein ParE